MKTLKLSTILLLMGVTYCFGQNSPLPKPTPVMPVADVSQTLATVTETRKPLIKVSRWLSEYRDNTRIVGVYAAAIRSSENEAPRFQLKVVVLEKLWQNGPDSYINTLTGFIDGKRILLLDAGSGNTVKQTNNESSPKNIKTLNFAYDIPDNDLRSISKIQNISLTVNNINLIVGRLDLETLSEFIAGELQSAEKQP